MNFKSSSFTRGRIARRRWMLPSALIALLLPMGSSDAAPPKITQVTGADPVTLPANQAETGYNVSVLADGSRVETVTYNDDTGEVPSFVVYSPTNRTIFPGASQFGWSTRTRTTANPDPAFTHAKLRPPTGTSVLWGDPSIASHPDLPNVVILANLAVPTSKFPLPAIVGSVAGQCSPLGGACVARSTDGGASFSMVNCFGDTTATGAVCAAPFELTKGHFYDGSSTAITRFGSTFAGFAAFVDTDTASEAIWGMGDVTANPPGPFVKDNGRMGSLGDMGDEAEDEGDLGDIGTHVRIRGDGPDLWKMSRDGSQLKVNIHGRNRPFKVVAANAHEPFTVRFPNDPSGQPVGVRTGPQFAFDIGTNEAGQKEMRFVYVASENGTSFMQAGWCTIDLADCHTPVEWRLPAGGQPPEFHPAIKFGRTNAATGAGLWKITYMALPIGGGTAVFASDLVRRDLVPTTPTNNPSTGLAITQLTTAQTPCPDLRLPDANGYWGDYDDMGYDSAAQSFSRPFVDSSLGCTSRLQFTSTNVHVSTVETTLSTRLHFTGTIDTTDAENIGSDEHGHTDIDDFCNVDPAHPVDNHFHIVPCTGDEVVIHLNVTCTLDVDNAVSVAIHSELREGDSCDPNEELEDQEDQSRHVEVGEVEPQVAINLTHDCFNCGDHAEIRLNLDNDGPQ